MCITVFGIDRVDHSSQSPLGTNLADGDGNATSSSNGADCAAEMEQFISKLNAGDIEMPQEQSETKKPEGMEMGYPPKRIPKHGPGYLGLGKVDRDWVRSVHHKMGHPDPQKLARFLQSTHARPAIVAGATISVMPVWSLKLGINPLAHHQFMRILGLTR